MIRERWFKALEDVMVCYDGTVRNLLGDLIQFNYGGKWLIIVCRDDPQSGGSSKCNIEFQNASSCHSCYSSCIGETPPDSRGFCLGGWWNRVQVPPISSVSWLNVWYSGSPIHWRTSHSNDTDTFHYAGVSSKKVTLGVPCLKEIINVATNIKTPSLTVYLEPEISRSKFLAKNIQQELAYTSLCTVIAAIEIWYDPDPSSTNIEDDSIFVEPFFAIPKKEIKSKLHLKSPWLLCLKLDRFLPSILHHQWASFLSISTHLFWILYQ